MITTYTEKEEEDDPYYYFKWSSIHMSQSKNHDNSIYVVAICMRTSSCVLDELQKVIAVVVFCIESTYEKQAMKLN